MIICDYRFANYHGYFCVVGNLRALKRPSKDPSFEYTMYAVHNQRDGVR